MKIYNLNNAQSSSLCHIAFQLFLVLCLFCIKVVFVIVSFGKPFNVKQV